MDPLILKMILSFIVGGFVVALSASIAERLSPLWAGVILGLPTSAVVGLSIINSTLSTSSSVQAVQISPGAHVLSGLLFAFYAYFRRNKSVVISLFFAILGWAILSYPHFILAKVSIYYSLLFFVVYWSSSVLILSTIKKYPVVRQKTGVLDFLLRMVMAGIPIASIVILSKNFGPYYGGLASSFPVVTLSAIIIFEHKFGKDMTISTLRNIPVGGLGAILFFLSYYFTANVIGFYFSMLFSYSIAIIFSYYNVRYNLVLKMFNKIGLLK